MSGAKHTPIPGWPGYFADEEGGIYAATGWRGIPYRELVQQPNADGYPSVRLTVEGKRKRISVHRLVAAAFLPPRPSERHEVRHLNGDKTNNRVSNLWWGTRKENAADRAAHGRTSHGAAHSAAIKSSNQAEGTRAFRARQREVCNG